MMPKIKNIIIFVGIAIALILIYIYFIKSGPEEDNLVPSGTNPSSINTASGAAPQITQEFLSLLLNIKNIRLDDSIFSEPAFLALHDSSILITPTGDEGRPNPFAPIGFDSVPSTSLPPAPVNTPAPGTPANSSTSGTSTSGASTNTTPPANSGAGATAN